MAGSVSYTPTLTKSVKAGAALKKGRFVSAAGAYAAAGGRAYGVTRTDAAQNEMVDVIVLGTAPMETEGAIAVNGQIMVGADGKAKAWAATNEQTGLAVTASAAAGDFVEGLVLAA